MTRAEFDRNLGPGPAARRAVFVAPTRDQPNVRAYADLYDDAVRMMTSKDLTRSTCGRSGRPAGEVTQDELRAGCMLARRLVERGVRFVEVDHGGWDTHVDNHKGVRENCGRWTTRSARC
jgi:hypothetical protein